MFIDNLRDDNFKKYVRKPRAIDHAPSKYLYIHSEVTRTDRTYALFFELKMTPRAYYLVQF